MAATYEPGQRVIVTDADGDEWLGTIQPHTKIDPKTGRGNRPDWYQERIAFDDLDGEVLSVDREKVRPA